MGKSLPSPGKLQEFARVIASNRLPHRPNNQIKPPVSRIRPVSSPDSTRLSVVRAESKEQQRQLKVKKKMGENSDPSLFGQQRRIPLADVVADCAKRWFQDTLKEAKAGDIAMQILVAQMYNSGYGVTADAQKVFPLALLLLNTSLYACLLYIFIA